MSIDKNIYSLSNSLWKKLHNRDKLSKYLPYFLYSEEDGIYINNNNTYGFVVEIVPRMIAGSQTASSFENLLKKMDKNMTCQIFLFGSKNDRRKIEHWQIEHSRRLRESREDTSEELRVLLEKSIENIAYFYENKLHESISKRMIAHLKDFRLYLSFVSDKKEDIVQFRDTAYNTLDSNNFYPQYVKPNELKQILYEVLNSNHDIREQDIPKYDKNLALNDQLICTDTEIHFTDYYSQVDDRYWINLSPNRLPEQASIADFGMKIGDTMSGILDSNQFKDTFIINVNLQKLDKNKKNKIRSSHQIIMTQNWDARIFRKFNAVREESTEVLDRIDVGNEDLLYLDMNVLVSGSTYEETKQNCSTIENYWNSGVDSPIVLKETKGIQQLCFLCALPMGCHDEYFDTTSKFFPLFSEQATQFLPLESDWKGTNPNIFLISRRGQLAGLDLFQTDGNMNGYIIAESGAGKSVLLNMIALSSYLRGDKVFIQDYGGSFKKLCTLVGGQYIEPDRSKPFSLNPFTSIESEKHLMDELDFLSSTIYGLGANKNQVEYEKNEKFIKSLLQEVIKSCYQEHGTKTEITDVKDKLLGLQNNDIRIKDFCQQIQMYCIGGIYELFFKGDCKIKFDSDFVVCEIQQVESEPDLRDPIISLVSYHQSNAIFKNNKDNDNTRFVNIYDEAHKYLNKSIRMDEDIEQKYRRGRKQGASTIVATQGFEDIYDTSNQTLSRAGKAIINSSSWKIFLKQSDTSINMLINSKVFNLNYMEEEMLRSTKSLRGEYSELFIITPDDAKFVYRLVLDKFTYYLTTTQKEDKYRISKKMEELGVSMIEAIAQIVKEEYKIGKDKI